MARARQIDVIIALIVSIVVMSRSSWAP